MNEPEARALVAMLNAAFPRESIEQATFDLYALAFSRFASMEAAKQAVEAAIMTSFTFPTIASIRETYGTYHLREIEAGAREERLAIEPVSAGPRVVPEVALRTLERLSEKSAAAKPREAYINEGLAELAFVARGRCDDCAHDNVERSQYGRFAVCRQCATSRLRVREMAA